MAEARWKNSGSAITSAVALSTNRNFITTAELPASGPAQKRPFTPTNFNWLT
jgi:hypothetical protein